MTSSPLKFIDSHAHLDARLLTPDKLAGVLQRARENNVKIVAIGTRSGDWGEIKEIVAANPMEMTYTVGTHPEEANENWREEIAALEKFLSSNKPCAMGEIGLDYYRLSEHARPTDCVAWQRELFKAQLSIAKSANLPLVLHSRGERALGEIVKIVDEAKFDWNKIVFHCFAEGPLEVREINARGARASFTGIITFKNGQKMREALIAQGADQLMLETDAPFLSPEPFRGQPNEPARIPIIVKKAAELLGMRVEELAPKVWNNTVEFFDLRWV